MARWARLQGAQARRELGAEALEEAELIVAGLWKTRWRKPSSR